MTRSGRSGTRQPMLYKEAKMTEAARHSLRRREEGGSLSLCRVPACAAIVGEFNCFDPNLHKELLPAPLKPITWAASHGLPGSTETAASPFPPTFFASGRLRIRTVPYMFISVFCTSFGLFIFETVFRIRIRIHRIHVLFGLADPHPLVRGMDPEQAEKIM